VLPDTIRTAPNIRHAMRAQPDAHIPGNNESRIASDQIWDNVATRIGSRLSNFWWTSRRELQPRSPIGNVTLYFATFGRAFEGAS
jgi:hypothetical protein